MTGKRLLPLLGSWLLALVLVPFSLPGQDDESSDEVNASTIDLYQEQIAQPIESGKGRFVGKLYDAKSGKPLEGVGLRIEETDDLTITDAQGRFIIDAVEPGTYTIVISQAGYRPMRAGGVEIKLSELNTLASASGALEPAPIEESEEIYEMDEIEVVV